MSQENSSILNTIDDVLGNFNDKQKEIINEFFVKKDKFKLICEHIVKLKEDREKYNQIIDSIVFDLSKDYAFLYNEYFCLIDEEWSKIQRDVICERCIKYIKNLSLEEEYKFLVFKKYQIVKRVLRNIRGEKNKSLFYKIPGSILTSQVRRTFSHLEIDSKEMLYLWAFLGGCLLNDYEMIQKSNHLWIGWQTSDIIREFQYIIRYSQIYKILKRNINESGNDLTNYNCVYFPYGPRSRRRFTTGIKTLPTEALMVFTHSFHAYDFSEIIGPLTTIKNIPNLLDNYLKTRYVEGDHCIYIDEFYEDFQDFIYQKRMPSKMISKEKFSSFLENRIEMFDRSRQVFKGKVAFVTKHDVFKQFYDKNIVEDSESSCTSFSLLKLYNQWLRSSEHLDNEYVHVDDYICERREIIDFMSMLKMKLEPWKIKKNE